MSLFQRITPEEVLRMPGRPSVDYELDRPPYTRYRWDGTQFVELGAVSGYGVVAPAGFDWTSSLLGLNRCTYSRDARSMAAYVSIADLRPQIVNTWYVDPDFGNDGTAVVNDPTKPLKNYSTAKAKPEASPFRIEIILRRDTIAIGAGGANNVQSTVSNETVIPSGYQFTSAAVTATVTYVAHSGACYKVTGLAANDAKGVMDFSAPDYSYGFDKFGVFRRSNRKRYKTLRLVADAATVIATPGTWYYDAAGTTLYVQAHDSRNLIGDPYMLPTNNSNNGRLKTAASNITEYYENVTLAGGYRAFAVLQELQYSGCVLLMNGCSFQGANQQNGLAIEAAIDAVLLNCDAFDNWADGINLHAASLTGQLGTYQATNPLYSPRAILANCFARGNGTTGSAGISDNAFTGHEKARAIDLGSMFPDSDDSTVAWINDSQLLAIGTQAGPGLTVASGREAFKVADNAKIWLDNGGALPGRNPGFGTYAAGAAIYHRNSGTVTNGAGGAGLGTVAAY